MKKINEMNLTDMEKKVLTAFVNRLQLREPGFSDVGYDDLVKNTEIDSKKIRGVLSSLIKKNLIWIANKEEYQFECDLIYLREEYYYLIPKEV